MKISSKQEYELLASISGRGEIPTKYAYLDGGEERWNAVYNSRSKNGGMADAELELILNHIDGIINVFKGAKGINLIDLGCGNGLPAIAIIKELQTRDFKVLYVPVDLSEAMLALATKNTQQVFKNLPQEALLIDFEKESLTDKLLNIKQRNNYPNLLLNLGNTLGNYVNAGSVLSNFLESMTHSDYLLVGNGIANDRNPQKIMKAYNIEIARDLILGPVKLLGLYNEADNFSFVWNDSRNRVEGRLTLSEKKKITLAGQTIVLEEGEELLIMQSNKYSEPTFTRLFSNIGFRTELLTTTKDRSHIVTLAQPTRYSVS